MALAIFSSHVAFARGPLSIDGDQQLRKVEGVVNPKAAGTADDPLIIRGLDIEANLEGIGLKIANTHLHVVFEDCRITRSLGRSIDIKHSSNILFKDSDISYTMGWFGSFPHQNGHEATAIRMDDVDHVAFDSSVRVTQTYAGAAAAGAPVDGTLHNGGSGTTARIAVVTHSKDIDLSLSGDGVWGSAGGAEGFDPGTRSTSRGGYGGMAEAYRFEDCERVFLGGEVGGIRAGAPGAGAAGFFRGGDGSPGKDARIATFKNVRGAKVQIKALEIYGSAASSGGASVLPGTKPGHGARGGTAGGIDFEDCTDVRVLKGTSIRRVLGGAGSTAAVNLSFWAAPSSDSGNGGDAYGIRFIRSEVAQFDPGVELDQFHGAAGASGTLGSLQGFGLLGRAGLPGNGGSAFLVGFDTESKFSQAAAKGVEAVCSEKACLMTPGLGGVGGMGGMFGLAPVPVGEIGTIGPQMLLSAGSVKAHCLADTIIAGHD